jgi:hypothetical protein
MRSPERKTYYRNKLYTAPQDARLKLDGTDLPVNNGASRTMYNQNKGYNSFSNLKNDPRGSTS